MKLLDMQLIFWKGKGKIYQVNPSNKFTFINAEYSDNNLLGV
jgi:hypothetical protein